MSSTDELSHAYLDAHPAEAARVLERLAPQDCAAFLTAAPARLATPVLRHMLPLIVARCLERLDDEIAGGLLHGVGPQAGAALLRHLPEPRRAPLLAQLSTPTAIAFRLLLSYSADTVGGWMDPHALALPADVSVRDALDRVRRSEQDFAGDLYVLDPEQRLRGAVELAELLRADTGDVLGRIARSARHVLPARSPLAAVHDHPGWAELRALPVVERGERFVGVLAYSVLTQALARDAQIRGTAAPEALVGLAHTYWRGVSGMIETVVGMFPVTASEAARTDGD
jgi:magnesium transporter